MRRGRLLCCHGSEFGAHSRRQQELPCQPCWLMSNGMPLESVCVALSRAWKCVTCSDHTLYCKLHRSTGYFGLCTSPWTTAQSKPCASSLLKSVSARQGLLEGSGEADASPREEALVNEIAALRSDVSAALKDVRESDGRATPELAPLLSSINSSLEALRSQVQTSGIRLVFMHIILWSVCRETVSPKQTACQLARWRVLFREMSALLSKADYRQIFCSPSSWPSMSSRLHRPLSSKHWRVQEKRHPLQLCRQVITLHVCASWKLPGIYSKSCL